MWEEPDWEEVQRRVERLRLEHPDRDIDGMLAGVLAGPPTPGRPNLPPWEYIEYAYAHSEMSLSELAAIRFPFNLFVGGTTVTSIYELRASLEQAPGTTPTIEDVVRLYRLEFEFGAFHWDAETMRVEEIMETKAYVPAVMGPWMAEIRSRSSVDEA